MIFRFYPEKFWNLIASKYAASPIDDLPAYQAKVQQIKTYLKADFNVLDIGCGSGTQCFDLAGEVEQITAIDISSKLLSIAEQRKAERSIENVTFVKTDVESAGFDAESFDMVMTFYVLHFYQNIDDFFTVVSRLLKPGGLFVVEAACMGEKNILLGIIIRIIGRLGFLPLVNLLTYKKIEQSLEKAGFTLLEKTRFSTLPDAEFTLIARKN